MFLVPFLLIVLILLVAAKYIHLYFSHRKLASQWHTEPIEFHRNTLQTLPILFNGSENITSGRFLQYLTDRFEIRNCTAFSLTVPFFRQLILSRSPEVMKAMFSTQFGDFNFGVRRPAFFPLLGNGIFASEGSQWKHLRNLLKPQFSKEQVGQVEMLEPHVQSLVTLIKGSSGFFDIEALFYAFTLDAASDFLFGHSADVLGGAVVERKERSGSFSGELLVNRLSFDAALGFVGTYLQIRLSLFDLYWLANSREFQKNIGRIHAYTDQYVEKALQLTPEEIEQKSRESYIFLYELVKHTRNPVEIRDELLNILIAGRATTALLLLLVFMELSRRPEIWEKLRSEVLHHFGEGTSKISFSSLKRCTYLRYVVNETLRLWPPVPQNLREAEKDTTLPVGGGKDGRAPIFVRKGSIIVILVYCVHRLKNLYGEDAEAFRPERWAGLSKIGWGFMPFGSGPRVCLGQQFALTEVSYVLVRLAQTFETITSGEREYPPKMLATAVLKYKDGVKVKFGE